MTDDQNGRALPSLYSWGDILGVDGKVLTKPFRPQACRRVDFRKEFGRRDYRKGRWGQTPGFSLRAGFGLSEQAHSTSSHGALLPTASQPVCPAYISNRLSLSLDSIHLLPLIYISQPSSTYFTFPGLNNYKEPSPQRRREDETKHRNL